MRKGIRRTLWGLGALVLVPAFGVLLILGLLHTDWGRGKVRAVAVNQLTALFNGPVAIGGLEGSLLGDIVIVDLRVEDRAGRPAVVVPRARVQFTVRTLLSRTFHASSIALESPAVLAVQTEGGWNLGNLLAPQPDDPQAKPWNVYIDELRMTGGAVEIRPVGAATVHVDALDLAAGIRVEGERVSASVQKLAAHVRELGADVALSTTLASSPEGLVVNDTTLVVSDSRIEIASFALTGEEALSATLGMEVTADDVRRFMAFRDPGAPPAYEGTAGLRLGGEVSRADAGAPLVFDFEGALGMSPLAVTGRVQPTDDGASGALALRLQDFAAEALVPGTIETNIDVSLDASGTLAGESIVGDANATLSGVVAGFPVRLLSVKARMRPDQKLVATASLDSPRGTADVALRGVLVPEPRLESLRVRANIGRLGLVLPDNQVDGDLVVDITGSGTQERFAARGAIRSSRLAMEGISLRGIDATFDVRGLPDRAAGTATVTVNDVTQDGASLGPVELTANTTDNGRRTEAVLQVGTARTPYAASAQVFVTRRDSRVEVRVARLTGRFRQLPLRAEPTEVTLRVAGGGQVESFVVHAGQARLEASATWRPGFPMRGAGTAEVALTGVDVAAMVEALRLEMPGVDGQGSMSLSISRQRGRLAGSLEFVLEDATYDDIRADLSGQVNVTDDELSVTLGARDLLVPGVGPLVLEANVRAAERRTAVEVALTGKSVGTVSLEAVTSAPGDLLDAEAWQRLDRRAIESASLTVSALPVAPWARLASDLEADITGRLDMQLTLGSGAEAGSFQLRATELRTMAVRAPASLTVEADVEAGRSSFEVLAQLTDVTKLTARGTIGVDGALWDRNDPAAAVQTAPLSASFTMEEFPLRKLGEVMVDAPTLEGNVQGEAEVSGSLSALRWTARFEAARTRIVSAFFRSLVVKGEGVPGRARVTIEGEQGNGGTLAVSAAVPVGEVVDDDSIDVAITAQKFSLDWVQGILGKDSAIVNIDGTLDADLKARGTLEEPRLVDGWLTVSDGSLRLRDFTRPLRDLTIKARTSPTGATVSLGAKSGKGSLGLSSKIELAGVSPIAVSATLRTDRFPVLATTTVLEITSKATMDGKLENNLWRLETEIGDTFVRIPRTEAEELHDTTPMENVTFVDERGRRAAAEAEAERMASSAAPTIRMHLAAPGTIRIRGEEVDARVRADLDVTYIGDSTVVSGTVAVVNGRVSLFGRSYDILTGRASFDGSVPPNPEVDVRLARDFGTLRLFIIVGGTIENPEISFASEPSNYDQSQLLAFVLGRDPNDPDQSSESFGGQALGVLSGVVFGKVQELLRNTLGVDVLRVETSQSTAGGRRTELVVGKWLTEDIFLVYRNRGGGTDPNDNTNEASVEYRLGRNWLLEAVYGDRGAGGLDILWVKRY